MTASSSSGNKSFKLHGYKHQGDRVDISCGCPDVCSGEKRRTKYLNMSISKAHKVVITTSPGLKDTWMRQWENVLFEVIQFVWTKTDM